MKFTNWLMKTEPDVYSIDDLKQQGVTPWEGHSELSSPKLYDERHVNW